MSAFSYDEQQGQVHRQMIGERRRGAQDMLVLFFGVTSARLDPDNEDKFVCTFVQSSCDGMGEETRRCMIDLNNTPEENMAIITAARQQQAWYQRRRSDLHAISPIVEEKLETARHV
ncbi:MAG: hypothetical protein EXS52_01400 [Candidatus Staskawiczbacteria bacterium]|nr:hypothetical protein [Candidatus Staskawiczbacteria bacterium]